MRDRLISARADAVIPFGARVLFRHGRAAPAPEGIANGTAMAIPWPGSKTSYKLGEFITVKMDTDQTGRDLHALANSPIMDPKALFLPAGRLSEADYQARVADQFVRAGITDETE